MSHPLKVEQGKYDPTLVEPWFVKALSAVYQEGIDNKYSRGSWKRFDIEGARKLMACAIRHIDAYRDGEFIDPDGGNPHLMKAIWNLATIYYHEEVERRVKQAEVHQGGEALLLGIGQGRVQERETSPKPCQHADCREGHYADGIQMSFVW